MASPHSPSGDINRLLAGGHPNVHPQGFWQMPPTGVGKSYEILKDDLKPAGANNEDRPPPTFLYIANFLSGICTSSELPSIHIIFQCSFLLQGLPEVPLHILVLGTS